MTRGVKHIVAMAVITVVVVIVVGTVNHHWLKGLHKERTTSCEKAKNMASSILRQNDFELIKFQRCHFYHAEYTAKDESGRIYMVDVFEDGRILIQGKN